MTEQRWSRALVCPGRHPGKFAMEERIAIAALGDACIPWHECTVKQLRRSKANGVLLDHDTLVVGPIQFMHAAMVRLGIPKPDPNDYPESLRPYLHRTVTKRSLNYAAGLFVKPRGRIKGFVGKVYDGDYSAGFRGGRSQLVWASEVVDWLTEFRIYVARGRRVGLSWYSGVPYKGNASAPPIDLKAVDRAIAAFEASGEAPAGYSLDFGLLSTGETALVEMNLGYSLGWYPGVRRGAYLEVLSSYWAELLARSRSETIFSSDCLTNRMLVST